MKWGVIVCLFFFNDTATTEIYTLSLHDALPICGGHHVSPLRQHQKYPRRSEGPGAKHPSKHSNRNTDSEPQRGNHRRQSHGRSGAEAIVNGVVGSFVCIRFCRRRDHSKCARRCTATVPVCESEGFGL